MVKEARDVLHRRLVAVFASEEFGQLWPGVAAPKVYLGFPVNEPPFYVAVDEVTEAVSTTGAASMGHVEVQFTLRVWAFAQHADLQTAADTMLAYVEAVMMAVCADHRLCWTVDNAFPSVDAAGTAADSSKRYNAAASVQVRCTVFSQCPAALRKVVENAESDG